MKEEIYDDFYTIYYDKDGSIIYPTNLDEVKIIKEILSQASNSSLIHIESNDIYYKMSIKRKIENEQYVEIVELSNVTEFIKQLKNANIDDLTQLDNRKKSRNLFREYITYAYNNRENFSVIMADLDDFKLINDTYGHANGDVVLKEVSKVLFNSTRQDREREQDIIARIGGDEFMAILKNISLEDSIKKAEMIRGNVEKLRVSLYNETNSVQYINAGTFSIGLYHVTYEDLIDLYNKGNNEDQIRIILMDRCDRALYLSKDNGRNQVMIYNKDKVKKLTKINKDLVI